MNISTKSTLPKLVEELMIKYDLKSKCEIDIDAEGSIYTFILSNEITNSYNGWIIYSNRQLDLFCMGNLSKKLNIACLSHVSKNLERLEWLNIIRSIDDARRKREKLIGNKGLVSKDSDNYWIIVVQNPKFNTFITINQTNGVEVNHVKR